MAQAPASPAKDDIEDARRSAYNVAEKLKEFLTGKDALISVRGDRDRELARQQYTIDRVLRDLDSKEFHRDDRFPDSQAEKVKDAAEKLMAIYKNQNQKSKQDQINNRDGDRIKRDSGISIEKIPGALRGQWEAIRKLATVPSKTKEGPQQPLEEIIRTMATVSKTEKARMAEEERRAAAADAAEMKPAQKPRSRIDKDSDPFANDVNPGMTPQKPAAADAKPMVPAQPPAGTDKPATPPAAKPEIATVSVEEGKKAFDFIADRTAEFLTFVKANGTKTDQAVIALARRHLSELATSRKTLINLDKKDPHEQAELLHRASQKLGTIIEDANYSDWGALGRAPIGQTQVSWDTLLALKSGDLIGDGPERTKDGLATRRFPSPTIKNMMTEKRDIPTLDRITGSMQRLSQREIQDKANFASSAEEAAAAKLEAALTRARAAAIAEIKAFEKLTPAQRAFESIKTKKDSAQILKDKLDPIVTMFTGVPPKDASRTTKDGSKPKVILKDNNPNNNLPALEEIGQALAKALGPQKIKSTQLKDIEDSLRALDIKSVDFGAPLNTGPAPQRNSPQGGTPGRPRRPGQ